MAEETGAVDGITFDDGAEESAPETEQEETIEAAETETEESEEKQDDSDDDHGTLPPDQQAKFDRLLNKRLARQYKAQEKLQQERDDFAAKVEAFQKAQANPQQSQRPVVPDLPDRFDDDFDEKVKVRDQALLRQAKWDAQQDEAKRQKENAERAEQQRFTEDLKRRGEAYTERAVKLKIKPEELRVAGKMLATAKLGVDVINEILDDDKGPALTVYLSKHLSELEKIKEMPPTKAAVYLATVIKPKALEKPVPNAPPPTERLKGAGAAVTSPLLAGATFE